MFSTALFLVSPHVFLSAFGTFIFESEVLWWHHGWIGVSHMPWGSRLVLTLHFEQNHLTDHFSSHLINISSAQSIFITEHAPSDRLCPFAFIYLSYLFILLPPSWYTDKLQLFPTIRATLKQSWMKDAFRPQQAAVIQSDRQKWSGHWSEVGCSKSVTILTENCC